MDPMQDLILASTSPYRSQLLQRLNVPFRCVAPHCDEHRLEGESASDMVSRLSRAKAVSLETQYSNSLIIGSDQSAELDGELLGKPGTFDRAVQQLSAASGRSVTFHTGICLLNAKTGHAQVTSVPYTVVFRELTKVQIERYLWAEKPINCAGSFKSEGLGITLFQRFEGPDPTALVGMPLMTLVEMLHNEGIGLP